MQNSSSSAFAQQQDTHYLYVIQLQDSRTEK